MGTDKMGHKPIMETSKNAIQKWEKCTVCGDSRVRGKKGKWHRTCPGEKPAKRYMAG